MSISGVSVETGSAQTPSAADHFLRSAFSGGGDSLGRLSALSEAKAKADQSLAELNLGRSAENALPDAPAKLAEAERNRKATEDTYAQAQAMLVKAEAERDGMLAEGQGRP